MGIFNDLYEKLKDPKTLAAAAFVFLLTVGSATELGLYESGDHTVSGSGACPALPADTLFIAEKQASQWHWTYDYDGFDASISAKCPSLTGDMELFYKGELVSQTDGKAFSLGKKVWIEDCHANPLFLMQIESLFEAFVDGLTFDVSMALWNADQTAIVGYVKGNHFWDDNFELVDASTGTTSATVTRDRTTFSWWKWKMNILNTSSPSADPRVLAAIAGERSFEDGQDICNEFFFSLGQALAVAWGMVFLGVLFLLFLAWKKMRESRLLGHRDGRAGVQLTAV